MYLLLLAVVVSGSATGLIWWSGYGPAAADPPPAHSSRDAVDPARLEPLLRAGFRADAPGCQRYHQPLHPTADPPALRAAPLAPAYAAPDHPVLAPSLDRPSLGEVLSPPTEPGADVPTDPRVGPGYRLCPGADSSLFGQVYQFLGWLSCQEWVVAVRPPFRESEGHTAVLVYTSLPAQVPVEIDVRLTDRRVQTCVVYLQIGTDAGVRFAGMSELRRVD